jgi:tetratricopeptide (TPR) repeat protein
MKETGREIHGKAEHAREAGNFLEALQLSEQAFLSYQEERNLFGMGDILASRSITLRLLFETSKDTSFLTRAKHDAMAGVEITRSSSEKSDLIMPLYRLGQVQEELEELSEACISYKEAVEIFESFPPKEHNRPAVLNDMKVRMYVCEYKSGNEDALGSAEDALVNLENDHEESRYTKDVWVSGGHMKLAEALKDHDLEVAKKHLLKAKEIIDMNPDLKLRKIQWEKLATLFE